MVEDSKNKEVENVFFNFFFRIKSNFYINEIENLPSLWAAVAGNESDCISINNIEINLTFIYFYILSGKI